MISPPFIGQPSMEGRKILYIFVNEREGKKMPELLTAQELAEKVFGGTDRMSTDKLYRLAKQKRIPAVRLDGRWFFPLAEIRAWIKAQCQVETTTEVLKHYGRLRVVNE